MDAAAEREFRDFVAGRSAALFRSAYLLTGQREAAEDLLQTVLARVARHWHRIEGAPDAYVRRALHHEQVGRWRRRGPTPAATGTGPRTGRSSRRPRTAGRG